MSGEIQNVAADQVYAALHSRPDGLGAAEIEERRSAVGPNSLEAERGLWWLKSLARQFTNFFTILLEVAAAICFVADHIQPGEQMNLLGWALLGVSALNALFSFFQEYRAERAMEELRKFLPSQVLVRRDGREVQVTGEELVPGDVIVVREGDRIPADARLVEASGLTVNNAPLTGESNPIALTAEALDDPLTESANLAFAGCSVMRGSGTAVVFATGFRSQFGRIAMLSREIRRTVSPLERETGRMVRVLTIIAVAMGLVFFAYGVVTGRSLWVNLVFMMGIIVANVPEGLLPTFTLSLAMGSLRMARRNVMVKSLNAVEALGSVHVICTDKTGTLTENRLTVGTLAAATTGEAIDDEAARARLLAAAVATADIDATDGRYSGDPLETSLADRLDAERDKGSALAILAGVTQGFPFDVQRRRAGAVAELDGRPAYAVKGAWEAIRPLVGAIAAGKETAAASEDRLASADRAVEQLARRGQRVIAVACRPLDAGEDADATQDALEHGLTLLGFVGFEDPLRAEVPDAVAKCRTAGIRAVMVTGDHPDTAAAIARQAGILADDDAAAEGATMTGDELAHLTEPALIERLEQGVCVFARTTPEQKMKIVNAFKQLDQVVAVTGDGVNDAPALKAADVGIAMGKSGTDVAREAAQVILLDDNFASVVAGVEEGRTIFNNIRKFTNYVLVSNGPEIMPYLIYMLFPVPLAMTVIQILSIDLGTDIIPSMALGQEKPDPEVMQQPPRDRRQALMSGRLIAHSYGFLGLIEAAFSLSLFFWVLDAGGWQLGQDLAVSDPLYRAATGITLSSILLMQIGNLLGRRSRFGSGLDMNALRNPLIVAGIIFQVVFSWLILYSPAVGTILGTGPVEWHVYAVAWAGPFLIFGLDYIRKQVARRVMAGPA